MTDSAGAYTKIPNEILDAMPDLGNAELRVLLAIARKTIGWQKECDRISARQIANMTGLTTRNAQQAITALLDRGLIARESAGKQAYCYQLKTVSLGDTDQDRIPSDTVTLGDTEPLPVGIRLEEKPLPVGIQQKKGLKEKKERDVGTRAKRAPPPPKQVNMNAFCEAVQVYKQLSGVKNVAPVMVDQIVETVIDIPAWRAAISAWIGAGLKPGNVRGILDWYLDPGRQKRPAPQNGYSKEIIPPTVVAARTPQTATPQPSRRQILAERQKAHEGK